MNSNILHDAKALLGDKFSEQIAGKLGESTEGIKNAISAILPTLFGGIAQKINNEPSFLSTVISEAKNIFANHSLNDLSSFVTGDHKSTEATQSGSFLYDVFGGKLHGILEKIAGHAGIKNENVRSLFETAQVSTLGSIGKNIAEDSDSEGAIAAYLTDNKAAFLSAIPASLGFGTLLSGVHETNGAAPHTAATHSDAHFHEHIAEDPASGNNRFFIPLILTIVIFGLIIWLFRGCSGNEKGHEEASTSHEQTATAIHEEQTPMAAATTGTLDTVTGNYIYNTGELITIDLPNGTKIEGVGKLSTENKLFAFLNDPNTLVDSVDKTKGWISFDRLYFKSSSSELTDESKNQLTNISTILKAFPNAAIKLGGYTDNTGNAANNLQLSADRAKVAQSALIADGIENQRVEAEGYGQEHPIASNDTPEGRAQNRRIDLRVTRK